jgi:hypothetical protein
MERHIAMIVGGEVWEKYGEGGVTPALPTKLYSTNETH